MNTPPPFPASRPALKLPRRPGSAGLTHAPFNAPAAGAGELDDLREREANLRAYESRLRALQAELDAGRAAASHRVTGAAFQRPGSTNPFGDEIALQAAWDKFHRARQLLEAEQDLLRNDRLAFRDSEAALRQREAALMKREASLIAREQAVIADEQEQNAKPISALQRFTQAPFLAALRAGK